MNITRMPIAIPPLRAFVALVGLSAVARQAPAQLQVTVTTPGGEPVAAAQVELWSATKRVLHRATDRWGAVRFTDTEVVGVTQVLARRIGFAPRRAPLPVGTRELPVVLDPLARALPEITVASNEPRCPQQEDPDARQAWETARRRYDDTTTMGRVTALHYMAGEVDGGSIGQFDPGRLLGGERGANKAAIRSLRQDIADHGYAWMLPERHYYWDYGVWGYPMLEADYAQHFTEASFGSHHTFSFAHSARSDEVLLRVCPINRKQSGLEGTLRLAGDGSFVSARWEYRNPSHDAERAGGEVVFSAVGRPGAPPILVAESGLFWRRLPSGRYYQRFQQYEGWLFTASDTLPTVVARD